MIKVNIKQIKTHFSKYLKKLKKGEVIVICKGNSPVAEMRAISQPLMQPRPIGLAKNLFKIPANFFEPLPNEFINYFIK